MCLTAKPEDIKQKQCLNVHKDFLKEWSKQKS